ncbi:MAG: hypothetical protein ACP5NX_01010 [Candidatus Bilamarchaeaceae archaeon]
MKRVYECETSKKAELMKILETDPYEKVSFGRAGYKVKDGQFINEDKAKVFVYISAADEFFKFADEKLKGVAGRCKSDVEERVIKTIAAEEEAAESGLGDIFG